MNYKYEVLNCCPFDLSYREIAEWITACRLTVKRDSFNDNVRYLRAVSDFAAEWTRHYEENKEFYQKPKFKTALLSIAVPTAEVFAMIDGKNQPLIMGFQTANTHYPFISAAQKILDLNQRQAVECYVGKIGECFGRRNKADYKILLDDIIKKHLTKKTAVQIKKLNGKKINEYTSYDELIKDIENTDNFKVDIVKSKTEKTFEIKCQGRNDLTTRYVKVGYQQQFLDYGISKTVYNEFLEEKTCEKEFDKKLFVNLGFLLSLPFSYFNTLLAYNGFSVDESTRKFDEIIVRAFKIGFGRDMAIDLIDFYNFELEDKYGTVIKRGKEENNFNAVPNLYSNK